MSERPSLFRKAGGKFNNVDGVINSLELTTEYPFGDGKPSKSDFNSLYAVVSARMDGADEDEIDCLWAGNADDYEIGDDAMSLFPNTEGSGLSLSTPFAKYVESAITHGIPDTDLGFTDWPDNVMNFSALVGRRVRFVQVDETDKDGKVKTRVAKKGKFKGKTFNQTRTEISVVYDEAPVKAKGKQAGASKTVTKAAGKPNGKAVEVDITSITDDALVDILTSQVGKQIAKAKLPVQIAKALGKDHPHKEEVRKLMYSDDYLTDANERGLIVYDADSKTQIIELIEQ